MACFQDGLRFPQHTGVRKDSATNRALAFSCISVSTCSVARSIGVSYEELHLGDFLVHILHELDDKVDQLVLEHLVGMEIRY